MKYKIGAGGFGGLLAAILAIGAGCSSDSDGGRAIDGDVELGVLGVPLTATAASGSQYRLRDAVFNIYSYGYWDSGYGGDGGSSEVVTVSSEDDPDADSITVSLEQGYYYVALEPGWSMEQLEDGEATTVEAQLLSSSTQWVYVSPHSTRYVEYNFGIGSREIWLNGNVNIAINVYEDPDQYYGGYGGDYGGGAYGGASNGAGGSNW